MPGEIWKKFQITNLTTPNNSCSLKFALKSVPGLADVGVPQGDGDGPTAQAPGSRSKNYLHHVDQHKKLERLNTQLLA